MRTRTKRIIFTTTLSVTLLGKPNELEVEVTASVTAGTQSRFDKSFGNYLPGDPEEVEIEEITLDGNALDFDSTNSSVKAIQQHAFEQAKRLSIDEAEEAAERAADARSER